MSEQDDRPPFSESELSRATSGEIARFSPEEAAVDGRDPQTGQFLPGNRAGRGNPLARRVALARSTLLEGATKERMTALADGLFDQAGKGDVAAAKVILSYVLGPPQSLDLVQQVETLRGLVLRGFAADESEDDQ
jgi:hypothetical protein